MINAKPQAKKIVRTRREKISRKGMLRLDMNEGVNGLQVDFLKHIISKMGHEPIAMYPEYSGLIEKIARHNGLKPENICITNGSDAAIKYIFDAYVGKEDKVLLTEPTFAMYPVYCLMSQASPVTINYTGQLEFPFRDFLKEIKPGAKLAVVVNPNNPTGSVVSREKLREIIKKARASNCLVLIDEAYFYYYPGTLIKDVLRFRNLIILRTFSKLLGIAGLRVGYAAAHPEIIENINKFRPTYDVNGIGVLAAERILSDRRMIGRMVKEALSGKAYLLRKLESEGIDCRPGHANFILIKCPGKVMTLMRGLLKRNILVAGGFKHDFLRDYIRVTVGRKEAMELFFNNFIELYARVS